MVDFHEANIAHFNRAISDPGGCEGVSCTFPHETTVLARFVFLDDPSMHQSTIEKIAGGRLYDVCITIPAGFEVTFQNVETSASNLRASHNITSSTYSNWDAPITASIDCNALPLDGVKINYEITESETCEEDNDRDESSSEANSESILSVTICQPDHRIRDVLERCLLNKWHPSEQELIDQFSTIMSTPVSSVEGAFTMSLCPDGTVKYNADNFTVNASARPGSQISI